MIQKKIVWNSGVCKSSGSIEKSYLVMFKEENILRFTLA
jgi:hypothetical protein